jgi:hypothetical protein
MRVAIFDGGEYAGDFAHACEDNGRTNPAQQSLPRGAIEKDAE